MVMIHSSTVCPVIFEHRFLLSTKHFLRNHIFVLRVWTASCLDKFFLYAKVFLTDNTTIQFISSVNSLV